MSTSPIYQQVTALINMMSDDERNSLLLYLNSLQSVTTLSRQPAGDRTDVDDPVEVLVDFITDLGGKSPSAHFLQKSSEFQRYKRRISLAWSWACHHASSKVERRALFLFGCKCLRLHMMRQGLPLYIDEKTGNPGLKRFKSVGLFEMMAHMNYLPDAVEASFPGYAKSGLILGVALRRLEKE